MKFPIFCFPIDFGTPDYDMMLDLRNRILRVPLNMTFNTHDLEMEWDAYHLGAFSSHDKLLACLVFKTININEVKMRQVAVDECLQGKGIGKKLVRYAELFAVGKGFNRISLNARESALPFYLGQKYKVEGDAFLEVGITHFRMTKEL